MFPSPYFRTSSTHFPPSVIETIFRTVLNFRVNLTRPGSRNLQIYNPNHTASHYKNCKFTCLGVKVHKIWLSTVSADTSVVSSTYLKRNCEFLHVLRAQKKNSGRRWTWIVGPDREKPQKQHGTWRAGALWVDSGLGRDPADAPPSWNLQRTGPPILWFAGKSRCGEQQTVRTHLHQHQSEVLIQDDSKGFVTREPKDSVSNGLYCDRL